MCDGTQYSTTTYASLFAIIGYTYGGTGSLFSVPKLVDSYIQGSSTSVGATISGAFTSPNGIADWAYQKGDPSGDGSVNVWTPRCLNSAKNGTNIINSFQTNIGVGVPTPIVAKPPSLSMRYLIKT